MKKLFAVVFMLTYTTLFGCASCMLMVPTAEIKLDLNFEKSVLKNAQIEWVFSDLYTQELLSQYDKNRNKKHDLAELNAIKKDMLDYLIPKNILTKISYENSMGESTQIDIKPKLHNYVLKVTDAHLLFSYAVDLNIRVEDNTTLSFSFEDDEGFFGFVVTGMHIHNSTIPYKENLYLFTAFVNFSNTPLKAAQEVDFVEEEEGYTTLPQPIKELEPPQAKEGLQKEEKPLQESLLKESIRKVKSLFESIEDEKNPLTYLLLLAFAYLYGVIHALGPGHGKTLVASYFLSNEKSYTKALSVSLAIGLVHTFSAFILTLIVYFGINTFLSKFLNDTVFYTTKISAVIIIVIALYLLYKKYRAYKKINTQTSTPQYQFSTTEHVETCACSACKVEKDSTDAALIISAGIIPCPGTVTIFIFSLSLGLYYAGFLSALVMSLGMSTIIFFSAVLSVVVRKKTLDSNTHLKKYLEYGSLFVILLLGMFLLIA